MRNTRDKYEVSQGQKKKATTQIGQSKREKSTRGDGICVGNLISALVPRLLGLAAAHAAVVEQHVRVSSHVQEGAAGLHASAMC